MNCNVENVQQGKKLLSCRLFLKNTSFSTEKFLIDTENDKKTTKFPIFIVFFAFFVKSSTNLVQNRAFLRNQVRYKIIQFIISVISYEVTRRERLKSVLYLRLKKRKTFFLMSHSAEKIKGGGPLGTSGFVGFLEKVKKGDPLHSSGFVGYV